MEINNIYESSTENRYLKQKITKNVTKPTLSDPDVKAYLQSLHRKYVIVTIL